MLLFISIVYIIGYAFLFASIMLDTTGSFSREERALLDTWAGVVVLAIVLVFYPLWLFFGAWFSLFKSLREGLTIARKSV